MISDADTVIDPWAMVVESVHALVADSAVSTPWAFDHLTFRTEAARFELLH